MTDATGTTSRPGWPSARTRPATGRRSSGPRRRLGRAPVRPRHDALVDDPTCPGRRSPSASAGSTRRPISWPRSPALEGFGEGIRDAGFTTAVVAGMGGSSLAPDVLASDVRRRARAASTSASSTRPTRRPWPRPSTTSTRSRPCSSSPASPARRPSRSRSRPTPGIGSRRRCGLSRAAERTCRRADGRDHRPRQEPRGDPPPRRPPRGVPQPAGYRRAVCRAFVRRARAGEPHRARSRRASRLGDGDAQCVHGARPGQEPRPEPRARAGTAERALRDPTVVLLRVSLTETKKRRLEDVTDALSAVTLSPGLKSKARKTPLLPSQLSEA